MGPEEVDEGASVDEAWRCTSDDDAEVSMAESCEDIDPLSAVTTDLASAKSAYGQE